MKQYGMTKAPAEVDLVRHDAEQSVTSIFDTSAQMRIARNERRDMDAALEECKGYLEDREIAESMTYRLERFDRKTGKMKIITGPSSRAAELIAYCLGNITYASAPAVVGALEVTALGMAEDMERNLRVYAPASRRIVGKNGVRYSDDMIELTKGVAQSIASRNAVLKLVPGVFTKKILDHAASVIARKSGDLSARWNAASRWAASEGITADELLEFLGVPSLEEAGLAELERLLGAAQAIKDGETTVDEIFRQPAREARVQEAEEISNAKPAPAPTPPLDPEPKTRRKKKAAPKAVEPEGPELELEPENSLDKAKVALSSHLGEYFEAVWTILDEAGLAGNSEAMLKLTKIQRPIVQSITRDHDPQAALRMLLETRVG